jgi:FkbM family methyltransferase
VKLRELLYLLGLPRPAPRSYGHEVVQYDLGAEGRIDYAHWLHPKCRRPEIREEGVRALRTFLRPGDVVVDIGAHAGDTPVPFALAVGPGGAVLAFEPNRYVFPVLERNAALNRERTRIIPYCLAIAPQDGTLTFEYGDEGFCNGGRHEEYSKWRHGSVFEQQVSAVRLESFLAAHHPDLVDRIRLVKVDTEGFDRFVLESMRGLIERVRPFIRTEVFVLAPAEKRIELIRTVEGMGYDVRRMRDDDDYVGVPVADSEVMSWKTFDLFCRPRERA